MNLHRHGLVAILVAGLLVGCLPPRTKLSVKPGKSAGETPGQAISLPSLTSPDGTVVLQEYLGRVVLLDFWATWSPPCREELPGLQALHQELQSRGFSVIGMAVDRGNVNDLRATISQFNLNYPVGLADDAAINAFGGIRPLPTRILIDRAGRIHKQYLGVVPMSSIRSDIEALLASSS